MLQDLRKAKLFFLYKFMVKVYFCSVACFYVLPLSEKSKKYLDAVNVPAERKEELAKYAQKMMKRQY